MKPPFPKIPGIIFCFLTLTNLLIAQEKLPLFQRRLQLNGETDSKEIIMPLRDSLKIISIKINAIVQYGELSVELYDPTGQRYGNFSIAGEQSKTIKSEDIFVRGKAITSDASGSLLRTIKDPLRGLWKARVITKNAVGLVDFKFTEEVLVFKVDI